jgi:hypothetical protein
MTKGKKGIRKATLLFSMLAAGDPGGLRHEGRYAGESTKVIDKPQSYPYGHFTQNRFPDQSDLQQDAEKLH